MNIENYKLISVLVDDDNGENKIELVELDKKKYIIKTLYKNRKMSSVACTVDHPNVLKVKLLSGTSYVMDYCENGDLFEYTYDKKNDNSHIIRQRSEIKRFAQQILCGLDYLHTNKIIHGDIKLENLLIDENNNIKIIDLDNSVVADKITHLINGTWSYFSPEKCNETKLEKVIYGPSELLCMNYYMVIIHVIIVKHIRKSPNSFKRLSLIKVMMIRHLSIL